MYLVRFFSERPICSAMADFRIYSTGASVPDHANLPVWHLDVADSSKWSAKTADFQKLNIRRELKVVLLQRSKVGSSRVSSLEEASCLHAYLESRCIITYVITYHITISINLLSIPPELYIRVVDWISNQTFALNSVFWGGPKNNKQATSHLELCPRR